MIENIIFASVRSQEGKILSTLRGKPFILQSVDDNYITVIPESTGKPRKIRWAEILAAYEYLLKNLSMNVKGIRDSGASEMNPAYVAAILLESVSAVYLDDENHLRLRT